LSASYAQVMWMRTQLQDYGFNYNKIPLYYDSRSATTISCNPVQHSRTKDIYTRYHFIKEQVENGIIELYFVRTEYQLADMFTKALPEDRFKYLVRRIVLRYDGDDCDKGKMPTKIELTLEQSQQGVSNDVLVNMDNSNITMEEYIRLEEEKARRRGMVFNWETFKYVNMHLLPSPEPTVSYFDDLDFFKDFEDEFPAIVYNDAQTSKSDLLTEPILSPQHIDEVDDKTSLSECDEGEQNVLNFNDLFPFNVIYPNDSKLNMDNNDD
nr:ribonuclease H [Tanacetum cinerariifolium]